MECLLSTLALEAACASAARRVSKAEPLNDNIAAVILAAFHALGGQQSESAASAASPPIALARHPHSFQGGG
jgi:hypothetical protein